MSLQSIIQAADSSSNNIFRITSFRGVTAPPMFAAQTFLYRLITIIISGNANAGGSFVGVVLGKSKLRSPERAQEASSSRIEVCMALTTGITCTVATN